MELAAFVTRFGNNTVLVPMSLVVALWLASRESPRMALLWLMTVAGVCGAIASIKMLLSGCQIDWWDVRSPSGHSGFSLIAYGGLAVVLGAPQKPKVRRALMALAVAAAVAIGISRISVRAHTPAEVVAGLLIAATGLAVFARGYVGHRVPRTSRLVVALLGLLFLAQGPIDHISMESLLERLGFWVTREVPICEARL